MLPQVAAGTLFKRNTQQHLVDSSKKAVHYGPER